MDAGKLLNSKEVMEILNIRTWKLRELISEGQLTPLPFSKKHLFHPGEVQQFMAKQLELARRERNKNHKNLKAMTDLLRSDHTPDKQVKKGNSKEKRVVLANFKNREEMAYIFGVEQ